MRLRAAFRFPLGRGGRRWPLATGLTAIAVSTAACDSTPRDGAGQEDAGGTGSDLADASPDGLLPIGVGTPDDASANSPPPVELTLLSTCDDLPFPLGDTCGDSPGVSILGRVDPCMENNPFASRGDIVVGRDNVYFSWSTHARPILGFSGPVPLLSQSVRRIPRCGGATHELSIPQVTPRFVTVAGGYIYWVEGGIRVREESGIAESIIEMTGSCVRDLVCDDSGLYYLDGCEGEIVRVEHGGTKRETIATGVGPSEAGILALGPSTVFVSTGSTVLAAPLTGGVTMVFHRSPEPIEGLVADRSAVYVTVASGLPSEYRIDRVPTSGGPATVLESTAGSRAVVDGRSVYWAKKGSDVRYDAILRTESAAPNVPEAVIPRSPEWFQVVGGRVYWVEGHMLLSALSEPIPVVAAPSQTQLVWERQLGDQVVIRDLDATASGDVVALASSNPPVDLGGGVIEEVPGSPDSATMIALRLDAADGAHRWSRSVPQASYASYDPAVRVGLGDAITTLMHEPGSLPTLFRFSSDSALLWSRQYPIGFDLGMAMQPEAFALDGTGGVLVGFGEHGVLDGGTPIGVHAIRRVEAVQGDEIWRYELGGPVRYGDDYFRERPLDLAAHSNGASTVLLRGRILRLSAAGRLLWERDLPHGELMQVLAEPDDGVLVVGRSADAFDAGAGPALVASPGQPNTFFARFDASGTLLWTRSYRGILVLRIEPDGHLTVRGHGETYFGDTGGLGNHPTGVFIARLDPEGTLLWSREFGDSSMEIRPVAPDRQGGAYIGGRSTTTMNGYIGRVSP
jgi:outer membrane protein assembly factor BamB